MTAPTFNSEAAWAVLVHACGAPSHLRPDYQRWCSDVGTEYRFQGRLGFGGKLWWSNGRLYVTCYPEDQTPARSEIMRKANAALEKLVKRPDPEPQGATS